ncbi:MAG: FAD-dependent oxidoreductase [Desulfobacteraceae bacterium]|nr:FAD-dependent oxidoreductase [Desulfobacteraceae bacterium]
MRDPVVIIGGGMSGLAAAIRLARFELPVLVLERHLRPGGLNSYYYRRGHLLETGLHAMTNYAGPGERNAPLNRLLRQLKLSRQHFITHEQLGSEIAFPSQTLHFGNDIALLTSQIEERFPASRPGFGRLVDFVRAYDPFAIRPWRSARELLATFIPEPLLVEMLLCPLMIYGNSQEDDMDLAQLVIMFQAVFLEGFFRPQGSIRDFLDLLLSHYQKLGGELRLSAEVQALIVRGDEVVGLRLASGEELKAQAVISTVGAPGTMRMLPDCLAGERADYQGRISFMESIYLLPRPALSGVRRDATCIFYSDRERFVYRRPQQAVDLEVGVINFPENFQGLPEGELARIRVTHPANYDLFRQAAGDGPGRGPDYQALKRRCQGQSLAKVGKMVGNFGPKVVYQDTFTPLTIEDFSAKEAGAVYGSPLKVKDGATRYRNLFLAGTDQGFLGIVGAMLSGVTVVNRHVLPDAGRLAD